jgi:hypothetical protein
MLDGAARIDEVVARPPTASRRSASPTTATCTASSTSTGRAGPGRQADHRHRGLHGPRPPHRAPGARGGSTTPAARPRAARSSTTTSPLLAENETGYKNLIQLAQPGVPGGLLLQAQGRLGAARGAQRGPHRHHRLPGRPRAARRSDAGRRCRGRALRNAVKAGRLQDIFGRDNLFVELQDHGIPEQHRTNPQLLEIARASGRRCWPPTTATTPTARRRGPRRAAVRADGSLMSDPTASSSTATSTT